MKKLLTIVLAAVMVFSFAGMAMAEEIPEGYTQVKVFDGAYGFGEAEISAATNDDMSAFYITFECFDEDQILEGTIEDGIVSVDYDLSGFVSGDAQIIWDDAVASENPWEPIGSAAAEGASEDAEAADSEEGESEGESAEIEMPVTPTAEADDYDGFVRDYANKELWFDSTVYGGFYSAYQIVQGNGDDTFDIDAFINSAMGEKVLDSIIYELCLLGDSEYASDYMINYWKGRGVIEQAYNVEDVPNSWLTFTPEYMMAEDNDQVYPVVFCFHGNGGTLFEAVDHGFVNICYDNEFIVVVPDNNNMEADLVTGNITRYLDQMEEEGYPIDRTKVYVTGMSKGNMSSMYAGIMCSDIIAGVAGHSGSNFFFSLDSFGEDEVVSPLKATAEEIAAANKMPLYLQTGACDMNQLPYSDAALVGINAWLDMLEAPTDAVRAEDNLLGITADRVYEKYIDGTRHTICEYDDADGVNVMTLVGIDNHPHWVTPSYAQNAWNFLQRFSRVDGELVISE